MYKRDPELLKSRIDLRLLVESELGAPAHRGTGAWSWACPFHDEQHGHSLAVWPNGWKCFGKCGQHGDAFSWLMKRRGITFPEALALLAGSYDLSSTPVHQRAFRQPTVVHRAPPAKAWQTAAMEAIDHAHWTLHRPQGENAFRWLRYARGFQRETIGEARLGFLPSTLQLRCYADPASGRPIRVPPGIIIPWFAAGDLWCVRIRTITGPLAEALGIYESPPDAPTSKYTSLKGSSGAGLYWADRILPNWPVFITEGEFNALTLWQDGMDKVCPVSLGSASASINPKWYAHLATASVIYAYFDPDRAGEQARTRIGRTAGGIRFVQLPRGIKDINDFAIESRKAGNIGAVGHWLRDILSQDQDATQRSSRSAAHEEGHVTETDYGSSHSL